MATGAEDIKNQAIGLTKSTEIRLPFTISKLKDRSDFESWYSAVLRILDAERMKHIVDIQVPHPPDSHPEVENWRGVSEKVAVWLEENMSSEMYMLVRKQGMPVVLADELMAATVKAFAGGLYFPDRSHIGRFWRIRREDFPSTTRFIIRVQQHYFTVTQLGVNFPPYIALNIILDQLDEDETQHILPEMKKFSNLQNSKPAVKHNQEQFDQCCDLLLKKVHAYSMSKYLTDGKDKKKKGL